MKTTKISDLIKESYLNYVSKDKCGLVLVSLPTALGKTYACCDAIASWCAGKPSDDRRHVVFITPLLKNLPERDLMEAFQRHGIDYKSNVLVIRSYRDCIVEANKKGLLRKILLGLLPESHADFFMGDENLEKLIKMADRIAESPDFQDEDHEFEERERQFRRGIRGLLWKLSKADEAASKTADERKEEPQQDASGKKTAKSKQKKGRSLAETLAAHPEDSWIGEIYPQVHEERYPVLLMSSTKLLKGQRCITNSTPYLAKEWLKDKIIFMDEFDSIKSDMKKFIIDSMITPSSGSAAGKETVISADIITLFNIVWTSLEGMKTHFSQDLIVDDENIWKQRDSLLSWAARLSKTFNTNIPYKYEEDDFTEGSRGAKYRHRTFFLYYCGEWQTVTGGDNGDHNVLIARFDSSRRQMTIHCCPSADVMDGDIRLTTMFNELDAFIGNAVSFFRRYTLCYLDQRADEKIWKHRGSDGQEVELHADNSLSYLDAVTTIFDPLNVFAEQVKILMSMYHMDRRSSYSEKEDALDQAYHYFRYGCKWFSLDNSPSHDARTWLKMVRIRDTPEQLLVNICRQALVIGMSATADCPTATRNFCLDYVKHNLPFREGEKQTSHDVRLHEILKENPEMDRAVRGWLEKKYSKYDSEITVETPVVLCNCYSQSELDSNVLLTFVKDPDSDYQRLAEEADESIIGFVQGMNPGNGSSERYFRTRYINVFQAALAFAMNTDHQSCLLISSALPKDIHPSMTPDEEQKAYGMYLKGIKEKIVDPINRYCRKALKDRGWTRDDEVSVCVLGGGSTEFKKAQDTLMKDLASGKRVLIISSYGSIAEGVNLQHPVCSRIAGNKGKYLVMLDNAVGADKKDIDETVLLDITHLVANLNDPEFSVRDQIANIMQAEECYEECIISGKDRYRLVSSGFMALRNRGKNALFLNNPISRTSEPSLAAAATIIQAVGRTNRAPERPRSVRNAIDEKLLKALNQPYILEKLPYLNPELRSCYSLAVSRWSQPAKKDTTVERAELTTRRAASVIRNLIDSINLKKRTNDWTGKTEIWTAARLCTLQNPTADENVYSSRPSYRGLYIRAPRKLSRYWYYQCGEYEYQHVYIDFDSRESLRARLEQELEDEFVPGGIHEVSAEAARLEAILRYPGMREFFAHHCSDNEHAGISFATEWEENEYIMCPAAFQAIYMGALGEQACGFILSEHGIGTEEIKDEHQFELMDSAFSGCPNVYADFKHYRYFETADLETRERQTEINRVKIGIKSQMLNAKAVFIINTIMPDIPVRRHYEKYPDNGLAVYYIPGLMNSDGSGADGMIDFIKDRLAELKEERSES